MHFRINPYFNQKIMTESIPKRDKEIGCFRQLNLSVL